MCVCVCVCVVSNPKTRELVTPVRRETQTRRSHHGDHRHGDKRDRRVGHTPRRSDRQGDERDRREGHTTPIRQTGR